MLNKYLFFFFFFFSVQLFSQSKDSVLNNFLTLSNKSEKKLVIVIPSSDCINCKLVITHFFSELKKVDFNFSKNLLVLTDNFTYINNYLKEQNISTNLKANKKLTNELANNYGSSIFFKPSNNWLEFDVKSLSDEKIRLIVSEFSRKKIIISDSIFLPGEFIVSSNFGNILLFDPLTQKNRIINLKGNVTSLNENENLDYILKLPISKIDTAKYSLISDKSVLNKIKTNSGLSFLHIKNIKNFGNRSNIAFSVNRYFVDKKNSENIIMLSNKFLTTRSISTEKELVTLFDFEKNDKLISFDTFSINNIVYSPLLLSNTSFIADSNNIYVTSDTLNIEKRENHYFGIIKISFDKVTLKMENMGNGPSLGSKFGSFIYKLNCFIYYSSMDSSSNKPIKFDNNQIIFNRKLGFTYITKIIPTSSQDIFRVVSSMQGKKGITIFDVDFEKNLIISKKNIEMEYYPQSIEEIDGKYYAVAKQMIDEDYNYGNIIIEEIEL